MFRQVGMWPYFLSIWFPDFHPQYLPLAGVKWNTSQMKQMYFKATFSLIYKAVEKKWNTSSRLCLILLHLL